MQTFRKLPTMQPRIKNTTDQNSNGTAAQRLAEGSVSERVILPGNESGSRLLERFEGSVGAQAHALAAPFDAVAEKCQEPKDRLEEVLDRDKPGVAPGRMRGRMGCGRARVLVQAMLEVQGGEDSHEATEESASEGGGAGFDDEPEQRPEGRIAQKAGEVRRGLADANGAGPGEMLIPD